MKLLNSNFILLFILSLLLYNCSSTQQTEGNFIVRIKQDSCYKYNFVETINGKKIRNCAALKGKVLGITKLIEQQQEKTYVEFIDKTGYKKELIPIEAVELVGLSKGLNLDTNWFEYQNNPLDPFIIVEVPIFTKNVYTVGPPPEINCPCQSLSINIGCKSSDCFPPFKITKREIIDEEAPSEDCYCLDLSNQKTNLNVLDEISSRWYFGELKFGYGFFNDKLNNGEEVFSDAFTAEIAFGYRLGFRKQYVLGLSYFAGIPVINSQQSTNQIIENIEKINRTAIFIHSKYSFDELFCFYPFIYGQIGFAIDKSSFDLLKLSTFCKDCRRKLEYEPGSYSAEVPISFGLGVGVDFPLSCEYAFSLDLGIKSLAIGEEPDYTLFGYLAPIQRRINLLLFRFGLSF